MISDLNPCKNCGSKELERISELLSENDIGELNQRFIISCKDCGKKWIEFFRENL